ncbi:MAG: hypothetical protein JST12_01525 [Armatimonadetes bacterium]|nr:hypothetical protein [Armatimonadota bacterium]
MGVTAIAVPTGTELGIDSSLPSITTTTVFSQTCLIQTGPISPGSGYTCYVQRGSSSALTGGTMNIYYRYYFYSAHYNTMLGYTDWSSGPTNTWNDSTVVADKINLLSVSMDSRKVYGKANIDGELPGDPNADLTTNVFNPWVFHGGHFVGNLPSSEKDLSGTARTQLSLASADTGGYLAGCITLFPTGLRGSYSSGTIGLFKPSSSDSNLTAGNTANWSNGWTLHPGGTQSGAGDFTAAPYYTLSVPSGEENNNYQNWQMPYASKIALSAYGGDGNVRAWQYCALCLTNESSTAWQYFSTEWTEAITGELFPLTDSRPRMWKVRLP